jgi:hypothetical protein
LGETALNCPKCGYEQDTRLDCLKCGIVFSKYSARNGDRAATSILSEFQQPGTGEDTSPVTLLELRQELRDLAHRFHEVEFERAERGQLRTEVHNLDRRIESAAEQASIRLDSLEKRENEPPPLPLPLHLGDQPDLQGEIQRLMIEPLMEKLAQIDARVQKLEESVNLLTHPPEDGQDRQPLEADVHEIRRSLDQIRLFVTRLSTAQ